MNNSGSTLSWCFRQGGQVKIFKRQRPPVTSCWFPGAIFFPITTVVCTYTYIPNLQTVKVYRNQSQRNTFMFQRLNKAICFDIRKSHVERTDVSFWVPLTWEGACPPGRTASPGTALHNLGMVAQACNPSRPEWDQEHQMFKVIFCYPVNSKHPGIRVRWWCKNTKYLQMLSR